MKTFIKALTVFLLVVEIVCFLAISFGILFKSLSLAGGSQLIVLGCTFVSLIYFIKAITPFYKKYISVSPVMSQTFPLIWRRLMYIALMIYGLFLHFLGNTMPGLDEMMKIALFAAIGTSVVTAALLLQKRERIEIFLEVCIRMTLFFLFHLIMTTAIPKKETHPVGFNSNDFKTNRIAKVVINN